MANMFIISISLLVVSQVNVARSLSEPECGCSSDLRLMYTFLDEKFTMKQEIKELKLTVDDLQAKLSKLGIDMKEKPRYVPGPSVNIVKDFRTVTQSSEYPTPPYPANLAIDGNSNTFSHTNAEPNAWWAMDFCNDVIIARVRLWNRSDCCDDQMANFMVTVDNEICGRVDGAIGVGKSIDVTCPKPLVGKVLKIQRTDNFLLSISELQLFSSIKTC